jgi:hypothetical protein
LHLNWSISANNIGPSRFPSLSSEPILTGRQPRSIQVPKCPTSSAMTNSHESPATKFTSSNPSNALVNPPPYNEYDSAATPSQLPPPGPAHNEFGPTPLTTQTLTPYAYYDARSPYSLTQADTRARRRFIVAALWAFGLWFAFGCLVTVELTTRRHGWWRPRTWHTIAVVEMVGG